MADPIRVLIEPEKPQEKPGENQAAQTPVEQPSKKSSIKMNMKIRRSLDGNAMIFDHKDIDIVVSPTQMKVVAFTKGEFSDYVYATQNRLFEFLTKKGIIDPSTIRGGHVYGSIEGKIFKPKEDIPVDQIVILNIGKWIEEEKPQMEFEKHYEEFFLDYVTEPEEEDSTDLGEVPHKKQKGTIQANQTRRYVGGWRE